MLVSARGECVCEYVCVIACMRTSVYCVCVCAFVCLKCGRRETEVESARETERERKKESEEERVD